MGRLKNLSQRLSPRKEAEASGSDEGVVPKTVSFPDGIEILHDCADATVDICFVHGLMGNRDSTWTAPGRSEPWTKTLLPPMLPTARILSYGYDAYVVRTSVAGSNGVEQHANNFLLDLKNARSDNNASQRPIIFVAHSLGGIVCKRAILLSRNRRDDQRDPLRFLFESTKGIIFMGTPHQGAWMAKWANIPAHAVGLVKSTNRSLLEILQSSNQFLQSIQDDFWSMIRQHCQGDKPIEVTCFYEELPMPVAGLIVSRDSATLAGYNHYSIYANHSGMVKFESANDSGFKRVFGELKEWTSDGALQRWMAEGERRLL
jgi:protein SERAC1